MFQNLTGWHALIILAIVLLIFGAARLPALARSLGQSVRILKDESTDASARADAREDAAHTTATTTETKPVTTAVGTVPAVSPAVSSPTPERIAS